MKAFNASPQNGWGELASSFSLTEKLDTCGTRGAAGIHDEHNQTDILTWGLNLAPAFPE